MKSILQVFLFFSLTVNAVYSQDKTVRLDSLFSALSAQGRLNGNVLVAEDGKVLYSRCFGYADLESQKPNDQDTGFQLASLSKVFTATAILQLAQKGKIKLTDPFSKYFPAFPYPDMTVAQLLSHSSGLSDQDLGKVIDDFEHIHKRRHTNADLVALIAGAKVKLKLSPGEKWWYCNLGYELLAALTEKVSGLKFDVYLDRNIFKPSGMTGTFLHMKGDIKTNSDRAFNYDYEFRYSPQRIRVDLNKPDYTEAAYGHSNMISTTADLFKFDQALYKNRLLKAETLVQALKPAKMKDGSNNKVWMNIGGMGQALDGLGWFIFADQTSGKTVWHAGGMQGAVTIMLRNISKKQTVILLDNTGSEGLYKSAINAMHIINNESQILNKRNLSRIYGRALAEKGADHAAPLLLKSVADTLNFNLAENDMINLGYAFLGKELKAESLETFKISCLLFPLSDNVFNSYGEALAESGEKEAAILMYQKSLMLNPGNEDSKKALELLINK